MKGIFSNKKVWIVVGCVAAVLAVIGIVLGVVMNREPAYRTVQVYQLDGEANVERPGQGSLAAYLNMRLLNGDRVGTLPASWLYMLMDGSTYLLAEPETTFALEATGSEASPKTKLTLESGALIQHITKALADDASYEVTTPNSTMAVRGTSFRVKVVYDAQGVSHTLLEVLEGTVEVRLRYPDGSLSEPRRFTAGQSVSIWGDDTTSDYDGGVGEIDYPAMDFPALEFLKVCIDHGDGFDTTKPEVDAVIALKKTEFPVRFLVDGEVFATQSVLYGNTAHAPALLPEDEGDWDFDFDTPVKGPVDIPWKR